MLTLLPKVKRVASIYWQSLLNEIFDEIAPWRQIYQKILPFRGKIVIAAGRECGIINEGRASLKQARGINGALFVTRSTFVINHAQ